MSAYFARLAQRSGAVAFGTPRAAAPTETQGIVEQETFVEAAPSSSAASDPRAARTASATNKPGQSVPAAAVPVAALPPENVSAPMSTMPAHVNPTSARYSPQGRAVAPMWADAPTERAAPETEAAMTQAAMATPFEANPLPREQGAGAARPTLSRDGSAAIRPKAAAPGETRTGNATTSAMLRSHEIAPPSPKSVPLSPFHEARASRSPRAIEGTQPTQVRTERTQARTPESHRGAREHAGAASAPQIDVHIGAVRLEIHAQPAQTPAPAAARAPARAADERPRFAPRRYYLRG